MFVRNFSFLIQVELVANHKYTFGKELHLFLFEIRINELGIKKNFVLTFLKAYLVDALNPIFELFKRLFARYVINEHDGFCLSEVTSRQCMVSLLSGRIP